MLSCSTKQHALFWMCHKLFWTDNHFLDTMLCTVFQARKCPSSMYVLKVLTVPEYIYDWNVYSIEASVQHRPRNLFQGLHSTYSNSWYWGHWTLKYEGKTTSTPPVTILLISVFWITVAEYCTLTCTQEMGTGGCTWSSLMRGRNGGNYNLAVVEESASLYIAGSRCHNVAKGLAFCVDPGSIWFRCRNYWRCWHVWEEETFFSFHHLASSSRTCTFLQSFDLFQWYDTPVRNHWHCS